MTTPARDAYARGADVAVGLVTSEQVATAWDEPSVLDGMSVGELAAHLARSVLQVEWYLDGPLDDQASPVTAEGYYADLSGTSDLASSLNTGVRARSAETAAQGVAALVAQLTAARERLRHRIEQEPTDRRMTVRHQGHTLLLDEYLRTRCVELAVHTEDLALSLGSDVRTPAPTLAVAVEVLVGAARRRHGDDEVLHALARRERDGTDALRVL
ncbi:maleylpyruvate isomerase N-terminal domain-containing protein [Cellulomonas dongxiuzhuiae]|uniref:maleylpyruvate isomerase N-terminal domain-containing protein n=1 Tax=Cellulomonas dongxiuzhuiae TaxID=2819979 RepID=UPI001AB01317|nr:maleylpyruvate isomerase N-terminal domain-containing protein [Cellulomonas dongxiuzhuiae]MBO3087000.1 maleylpyruvate isomerase N-terminal domain-containing protein [Cellulomonas dongxiuzhuiae]